MRTVFALASDFHYVSSYFYTCLVQFVQTLEWENSRHAIAIKARECIFGSHVEGRLTLHTARLNHHLFNSPIPTHPIRVYTLLSPILRSRTMTVSVNRECTFSNQQYIIFWSCRDSVSNWTNRMIKTNYISVEINAIYQMRSRRAFCATAGADRIIQVPTKNNMRFAMVCRCIPISHRRMLCGSESI